MADPKPDALSVSWMEWSEERRLVADLIKGTKAIRDNASEYLPQHPSETVEAWEERTDTAVSLGVVNRAADVASGLVVRHPPQPEADLPEWLTLDEATNQLGGLTSATANIARKVIMDSWVGVWVDQDVDDVNKIKWKIIPASDVLGMEMTNGRVTGLRLMRISTKVDENWEETQVEEVWAMRIDPAVTQPPVKATIDIWRRLKGKWVRQESNTASLPMPHLPLAIGALDRMQEPTRPPLLDLAYEALRYTQIRSDRDAVLRIASNPIPVTTGAIEGNRVIEVGPGLGIELPIGGDFKIVEVTGKALEASRQELLDTERRMASLSLALIERHVRGAESAESRKIDEAQASAALRTIGRATERVLTEACRIHAAWRAGQSAAEALPDAPIRVAVTQTSMPLSPEEMRILADLVAADLLSPIRLLEALERGEIIPQGTAVEEARLAEEAREELDAERAEAEAAAALATAAGGPQLVDDE